MSMIDDEQLMAYADGALDADEAAAVERAIADDPVAREKVEAFKESRALAQHAFDAPAREPVPDRLIDTIMAQPPKRKARRGWRLSDWLGGLAQPGLPVAASILLLIGFGGGYLLNSFGGQGNSDVGLFTVAELDRRQLGRALDTVASGKPVSWRSERSNARIQLLVRATFRNKRGEFCREYEEDLKRGAQSFHFFGIACRTGKMAWETRVVVAAPPADAKAGSVFRPAGDSGLEVIETALDGMIKGKPLSKEQEEDAMKKGWPNS